MNATIMQTMIWLSAGGLLFLFMRRRKGRKAPRFFPLVREQQPSRRKARSRPRRSSVSFSGSHGLASYPPRLSGIIPLHCRAADSGFSM